jgi:hypothetical protein
MITEHLTAADAATERERRRAYRAEIAEANHKREARGAENLSRFVAWSGDPQLEKLHDVPCAWLRWVRHERKPADSMQLYEAWLEEDDYDLRSRRFIDHPMALASPRHRLFVTEVYDCGSTEQWKIELPEACARAGLSVLFLPRELGFWNAPSCYPAIIWKRGLWVPPTKPMPTGDACYE